MDDGSSNIILPKKQAGSVGQEKYTHIYPVLFPDTHMLRWWKTMRSLATVTVCSSAMWNDSPCARPNRCWIDPTHMHLRRTGTGETDLGKEWSKLKRSFPSLCSQGRLVSSYDSSFRPTPGHRMVWDDSYICCFRTSSLSVTLVGKTEVVLCFPTIKFSTPILRRH